MKYKFSDIDNFDIEKREQFIKLSNPISNKKSSDDSEL